MQRNLRSILAFGIILTLMLSLMPTGVAQAASTSSGAISVTTKAAKAKSVTSVSLNKKTLQLNVGAKSKLTASVKPKDATNKKVTWKSSKTSIATVDKNGNVTAKKAGTAVITVTTSSGKKTAKCTVTVVIPVKSVKLNTTSKSLKVKDTYQLKATVSPSNATKKTVTWSSNKPSVAKVDKKGKVTAVAKGTATITAKAGSKTVKCKITVTASSVKRAFVIGQTNYRYASDVLPGGVNDMRSVCNMLEIGGYKNNVYYGEDFTGNQLVQFLSGLSTVGISSSDITLFYYSGHGVNDKLQQYRGALVGVDNQIVTVNDVQKYLDKVPGTVIVVLDCCLSGQYIQSKAYFSGAESSNPASVESFNQGIIDAFSGPNTKALTDSPYKSKYKIITACQPLENSSMRSRGNYYISDFTYWFAKGGGFDPSSWAKTSMKADSNKDNTSTLRELHAYIKKGTASEKIATQNVMMWPSNDSFAIVKR